MRNGVDGVWVIMGMAVLLAAVALTWVIKAIASEPRPADRAADPSAARATVYDFKVPDIDGKEVDLSLYRGKALLIVNTASRCGFTPQYAALEKLYASHRSRGFEILAFPANNFMGQEPGTNAEIKEFCALKFKTTFPLFSKISVKGEDIHPLYRYLTTASGHDREIGWNFTKFVVAPDGRVTARFGSRQDPLSAEVLAAIEAVLPQATPAV